MTVLSKNELAKILDRLWKQTNAEEKEKLKEMNPLWNFNKEWDDQLREWKGSNPKFFLRGRISDILKVKRLLTEPSQKKLISQKEFIFAIAKIMSIPNPANFELEELRQKILEAAKAAFLLKFQNYLLY